MTNLCLPNTTVRIDWNAFCYDTLFRDVNLATPHLSTWQRLSHQIVKHYKFKVVPASMPRLPKRFEGKSEFDRSFNVAMALTVRALTIKGVSPANIAKTQLSLRQQQLQHKELQQTQSVESTSLPHFKPHPGDSVAPIRRGSSLSKLFESARPRQSFNVGPPGRTTAKMHSSCREFTRPPPSKKTIV